jgi:mannosidase alpha-like ER degradation enhancer 1
MLMMLMLAAAVASGMSPRDTALDMISHAYTNYMQHAFPHDELKPLSASYTDSLELLGNAPHNPLSNYQGTALTLIDSIDTLILAQQYQQASDAILWITQHISFDIDVRVHLFETNIRVLGGLLAAHFLATDHHINSKLTFTYNNQLVPIAQDLGYRLLPAFKTNTGLPYAWINLKHGVLKDEVLDSCTAGAGTLLLEFGALSFVTKDMTFYNVAKKALLALWDMRCIETGLIGNSFNIKTKRWTNSDAGIGSGIDSFYEYLLKSYVLFGDPQFYEIFQTAYNASNRYLKNGPWYIEAEMFSGRPIHFQFNSLQAFWPGMQILYGDLEGAIPTIDAFYSIWEKYGALPERFLFGSNVAHSTEYHYPLRPELVESIYFAYRATKNSKYLEVCVPFII